MPVLGMEYLRVGERYTTPTVTNVPFGFVSTGSGPRSNVKTTFFPIGHGYYRGEYTSVD